MKCEIWTSLFKIFDTARNGLKTPNNQIVDVDTTKGKQKLLALRTELRSCLSQFQSQLLKYFQGDTQKEQLGVLPVVVYLDEFIRENLSAECCEDWPALQREKDFGQIEYGGTQFYTKLDEILVQSYIDSMNYELFYYCLKDGFGGKYAQQEKKREEYQSRLQTKIPTVPYDEEKSGSPPPHFMVLNKCSITIYFFGTLFVIASFYVAGYFFL